MKDLNYTIAFVIVVFVMAFVAMAFVNRSVRVQELEKEVDSLHIELQIAKGYLTGEA